MILKKNDTQRDVIRPPGPAWPGIAIVAFTAFAAVGLAFFGVGALVAPAKLLPPGASMDIYPQFLAARNLPIALGLVVALFVRDRRILATLLAVGGGIALGDLALGLAHGALALIVFAAIVGAAYLAAAAYLFTRPRNR